MTFVDDDKRAAQYKWLFGRAEMDTLAGRYERALGRLRRARRIAGNKAPIAFEYGRIYLKLGVKAKQAKHARRAIANFKQARRYFRDYVGRGRGGRQLAEARRGLDQIRRELNELRR